MKKQKTKTKARKIADIKRGTKRSQRLKKSRHKVVTAKRLSDEKKFRDERDYNEKIRKLLESRFGGEN